MDPFDPPLDTARHLRYWQRCLRSMLPHHYTSMDSSRLSLCYFIIVAVDMLSKKTDDKPILTASDRLRVRSWVLSCQHPLGGFTGSPTHVLPPGHQHSDRENANVAGTFFALMLLALVAEDEDMEGEENGTSSAQAAFAGVDRVKILRWLRRLQRPDDGSFGEVVYDAPERNGEGRRNGQGETLIAGGRDMRYCYLAAAIRWMLRGDLPPDHPDYVPDIDVPALVNHIRRGQTYDGGFAESWRHESHAGYGYCGVAALALLDRPLQATSRSPTNTALPYTSETIKQGIPDPSAFISWCFSRQFVYLSKEDQQGGNDHDNHDDNDDDDDDDDDNNPETANFSLSSPDSTIPDAKYIGFNGRCNKVADTCYVWWTLGALAVLDLSTSSSSSSSSTDATAAAATTTTTTSRTHPATTKAQRLFLLDKTQHLIGGFGKHPGSPPDVGHASLGLAALATMGDPSLKRLDPVLCVSVDAVRKLELARDGLLNKQQQQQQQQQHKDRKDAGQRLVDMAARMGGIEPSAVVETRA